MDSAPQPFTAMVLSLALAQSMRYNSRRLEAIGYAFSVLFLQHLIDGYEDIFLVGPQFPIYVSPRDVLGQSPDETVPDAQAKGVYVDHALLVVHSTQRTGAFSQLTLAQAFRQAHRQYDFGFCHHLDVTHMQAPVLEEKKRSPTRHPQDIEEHVTSIFRALRAACAQVLSQAQILFASPRFMGQDLVILVASSGEYYRLGVARRDHPYFLTVPDKFTIDYLIESHKQDTLDVEDDIDHADLSSQLDVGSNPTERERYRLSAQKKAEEAEKEQQTKARNARALARRERQLELSKLEDVDLEESQLILEAGDPPYSDELIEKFQKIQCKSARRNLIQHNWTQDPESEDPKFFEPEPSESAAITDFTAIDPGRQSGIIFSAIIKVGSPASKRFIKLIQSYLEPIAQAERTRREQEF